MHNNTSIDLGWYYVNMIDPMGSIIPWPRAARLIEPLASQSTIGSN